MKEIIGDYEAFVEKTNALLDNSGISRDELVQCDTLCYRVETNTRYDDLKRQLASKIAWMGESTVNGRLIAAYGLNEPLVVPGWQLPVRFLEIPQPKPNNKYAEGLEHAQFVTADRLSEFHKTYAELGFDTSGLQNQVNPLLELNGDVTVKFHDKHMGSVIDLEHGLRKIEL
jgi:predicted metalloenzyme YecM